MSCSVPWRCRGGPGKPGATVVSDRKNDPAVSAPVALRRISDPPPAAMRSPSPGPCTIAGIPALLDLLDLEHARGPRLAARQAGGDPDALAALAPAEVHHAAGGVRDERLGDLVAAHRSGLHAPHEPAAADRLAPRREGVDRHVGTVRGDEPRRAPAQRRDDERVEAELARGDAGRVRD